MILWTAQCIWLSASEQKNVLQGAHVELKGYKQIPGPASLLASHHIAIDPGRDISCQRYMGVDKEWIIKWSSMRLVDFPIIVSPGIGVGEAHDCRPTSNCICYGDGMFDSTYSHGVVQGNIMNEHLVCTTNLTRLPFTRAKTHAAWQVDSPAVLLLIVL